MMLSNCVRLPSKTSVYVLVENRLLREALVRLFQKRAGMSVTAESHYSESTMSHLASTSCDVLLLDSVTQPGTQELIAEIHACLPQIKVVLLGMNEEFDCFLVAVRLGVCAYLLKESSATEIVSAVRSVERGEAICPAKLCMSLFRHVATMPCHRPSALGLQPTPTGGLTCRQRQLMVFVAGGMTNKEIAARLNLSEYTVKNHIHRIMRHVEADSRHEAVDVMRESGILATA
jgi:two-component system, NarL family, response regulator DevR